MAFRISKLFRVEIVAVLLAAVLAAATLYYFEWRKKPRISLDQAWAIIVPAAVEARQPGLALFAVDAATQGIVPWASLVIFAKKVTTKLPIENIKSSYLGMLKIENNGEETASEIRVGLGYKLDGVEFTVRPLPNVKVRVERPEKLTQSVGMEYVQLLELVIEKLPPRETAVISLGWCLKGGHKDSVGHRPDLKIQSFYSPDGRINLAAKAYFPRIFYANSNEARGIVRDAGPLDEIWSTEDKRLRGLSRIDTQVCGFPEGTYWFEPIRFVGNDIFAGSDRVTVVNK